MTSRRRVIPTLGVFNEEIDRTQLSRYAAGDLANNLAFSLQALFLLIYYTNVDCDGVDLALPNACVFRVVDHSYDEGRIGISGPAFSRRVTQRQRGHHKSWTWPAGRATPRVSKKRREAEAIASTS